MEKDYKNCIQNLDITIDPGLAKVQYNKSAKKVDTNRENVNFDRPLLSQQCEDLTQKCDSWQMPSGFLYRLQKLECIISRIPFLSSVNIRFRVNPTNINADSWRKFKSIILNILDESLYQYIPFAKNESTKIANEIAKLLVTHKKRKNIVKVGIILESFTFFDHVFLNEIGKRLIPSRFNTNMGLCGGELQSLVIQEGWLPQPAVVINSLSPPTLVPFLQNISLEKIMLDVSIYKVLLHHAPCLKNMKISIISFSLADNNALFHLLSSTPNLVRFEFTQDVSPRIPTDTRDSRASSYDISHCKPSNMSFSYKITSIIFDSIPYLISNEICKQIGLCCKNLSTCRLYNSTSLLNDKGIGFIIKGCRELEFLDIGGLHEKGNHGFTMDILKIIIQTSLSNEKNLHESFAEVDLSSPLEVVQFMKSINPSNVILEAYESTTSTQVIRFPLISPSSSYAERSNIKLKYLGLSYSFCLWKSPQILLLLTALCLTTPSLKSFQIAPAAFPRYETSTNQSSTTNFISESARVLMDLRISFSCHHIVEFNTLQNNPDLSGSTTIASRTWAIYKISKTEMGKLNHTAQLRKSRVRFEGRLEADFHCNLLRSLWFLSLAKYENKNIHRRDDDIVLSKEYKEFIKHIFLSC